MQRRVNPADPHKSPNAEYLDGLSCAAAAHKYCWTQYASLLVARAVRTCLFRACCSPTLHRAGVTSRGARTMFGSVVRGVFGVDPGDLSFLHFLAYVASSKSGLEDMITFGRGLQEYTFKGGAAQLCVM